MRRVLLLLVLAGACRSEGTRPMVRMPYEPAVDAGPAVPDGGVGFDFRWLRIDPSHVGQNRRCDVAQVLEREPVTHRSARPAYGDAVERVSVACATTTGADFVDLIFPAAARSQVHEVRVGRRIDVSVRAPSGGFDDLPIVEFRATLPVPPPVNQPPPLVETVPAASDFRVRGGRVVTQRGTCALTWVGAITPVAEEARDRFPAGATHFVPVNCAHTVGDAPVELVSTLRGAPALLRLRRGARVRIRILAIAGGSSDAPVAVLAR